MKKIPLSIISAVVANVCYSQQPPAEYHRFIHQADSLYEAKQYLASGAKYSEAFKSFGWKGRYNDRYNAACTWALAGVPDSAFFQLERLVFKGGDVDIQHTSTDKDLLSLHADKRWQRIKDQMKLNKELAEAKINRPLKAKLDSIYADDQNGRLETDVIEKKYGWDSPQMRAAWKEINRKDSINLIKVKAILDTYGWLGADVVGAEGNSTLFLVIQHSDQATQEKYLPMMREAVKQFKAHASSLALLEDRVALGQGKRQTYGSQIGRDQTTKKYYVLPLEDPDHVDERRAAVGLEPLSDYVSNWEIVWNVEQYKKDLPQLEKK